MSGITGIDDSRPIPSIEWQLTVDRTQAGLYGIDVATVGNMVRLVTSGIKVSSFRPDDSTDELDIVVRYPSTKRTMDQLDNLIIQTPKGNVPVSSFVKRTASPNSGEIVRINGRRVLSISADVEEGILAASKVQELKDWLTVSSLPPEISLTFEI